MGPRPPATDGHYNEDRGCVVVADVYIPLPLFTNLASLIGDLAQQSVLLDFRKTQLPESICIYGVWFYPERSDD